MKLYSNKKSTISNAHNPLHYAQIKHMKIDPFADFLTNWLLSSMFQFVLGKLGMEDVFK